MRDSGKDPGYRTTRQDCPVCVTGLKRDLAAGEKIGRDNHERDGRVLKVVEQQVFVQQVAQPSI
jgi:hypothetical protein